jgi:hypothetical protein
MEDLQPVLSEALRMAPGVFITMVGLYGIIKMMLAHFETTQVRREAITDAKDRVWLDELHRMSKATTICIDTNTEMLGSVREIMRSKVLN